MERGSGQQDSCCTWCPRVVRYPEEPGNGPSEAMAAIQRAEYDTLARPARTLPAWMARLPDHWPVARVTMPGSHDTMALHGGVVRQCQSWPLHRQLRAGLRFLDIRCRHVRNELPIYHMEAYQMASLHDVLWDCRDFLEQHQSEFLLMRLQEEYIPEGNTQTFSTTLESYLSAYPSGLFWRQPEWPTVAQARGKIIVLQNFEGPQMGTPYESMDIDDKFQMTSFFGADEKWRSVESHLNAASQNTSDRVFLTFSSGKGVQGDPTNPFELADVMNPHLYAYIRATSRPSHLGIILMDFPGAELAQRIVQANFKEDERI